MDAHILETTWAPLWIFFNLLVSTGLTWATTGKDVSIERCPKALIRRQSCLTESCVQRAVLEEVMNGRRLSESKKKKKKPDPERVDLSVDYYTCLCCL